MIVTQQKQRDTDSDGVDRDVHRGSGPALDEALVILVRNRVGERNCARDDGWIPDHGPQRPPPQRTQAAEHQGVSELAQDRVPYAEPAVEIGLRGQNEDHRHQRERSRGAPCGAGEGSHWTHSRRVQPLAR